METYGEWKNALLGGMLLNEYILMESLYPEVEETIVPTLSNTGETLMECIISSNIHVEQSGKNRKYSNVRLDRSRHRCVHRRTKHIEENYGIDYFTERDEKNLYILGLVPLTMSDEKEFYIKRCVKEEQLRIERKEKIRKYDKLCKQMEEDDKKVRKKYLEKESRKVILQSNLIKNTITPGTIVYCMVNRKIRKIENTTLVEYIVFETRKKCFDYYINILWENIEYTYTDLYGEDDEYDEYDIRHEYEYDEYDGHDEEYEYDGHEGYD